MIGFDSPEAQAEAFEQARAAFAAMQPALDQFQEQVCQVWDAITQIVRQFLAEFNRFWDALPVSVRAQFRARSQTIMRCKIRRYAFAYARRQ